MRAGAGSLKVQDVKSVFTQFDVHRGKLNLNINASITKQFKETSHKVSLKNRVFLTRNTILIITANLSFFVRKKRYQ